MDRNRTGSLSPIASSDCALMAAMGVVTDDPASPLVQEFFGGCHVLAVYPRKEAMVGGMALHHWMRTRNTAVIPENSPVKQR